MKSLDGMARKSIIGLPTVSIIPGEFSYFADVRMC